MSPLMVTASNDILLKKTNGLVYKLEPEDKIILKSVFYQTKIKHFLSIFLFSYSYVWLEVGLGHPEKIRRIVELQPKFMLSYKETLKDFTGR
jgi:hypothetical protein